MQTTPAPKNGTQSIQRIFGVIEALAARPGGTSLQQLCAATGLAKSTAHRMLASLVEMGYVVQDSFTTRYRLTLKLFELGSAVVNDMDILAVARPHLDRLSRQTGEAVHLVLRDGADIVYLYKAEALGVRRMSSQVGLRAPMYCTGVGKAILATLPPAEVQSVWDSSAIHRITEHTIVDFSQLCEQLRAVRQKGFAIDDEENELGIRCVAVALPGPGGKAEAAFSLSSLVPHMSEERIAQLAQMSLSTRDAILRDLGL
ncbi:transcriptional regulator [Anaerofilum sp. An201]|nr:IclR family transcriptional regulator [Anaerofilum sp. An201]OUP03837.1 transcriptional regulator [Anaerofilum sp. An201]